MKQKKLKLPGKAQQRNVSKHNFQMNESFREPSPVNKKPPQKLIVLPSKISDRLKQRNEGAEFRIQLNSKKKLRKEIPGHDSDYQPQASNQSSPRKNHIITATFGGGQKFLQTKPEDDSC